MPFQRQVSNRSSKGTGCVIKQPHSNSCSGVYEVATLVSQAEWFLAVSPIFTRGALLDPPKRFIEIGWALEADIVADFEVGSFGSGQQVGGFIDSDLF